MPKHGFVGVGEIMALNDVVFDCDDLLQEKISSYQSALSASRSAKKELDRIYEHSRLLTALTDTIHLALKECDSESNPGVKAAIEIVLLYHDLLNNKTTLEKVIEKLTASLRLLPDDIQNCRINLDKGQRLQSALWGLGCAIAGFGLSLFLIVSSPVRIIGFDDLSKAMWSNVKKNFLTAFDQFKETWTGKKEPPEMKKLEKMLGDMDSQLKSGQPATAYGAQINFFSLEQKANDASETHTHKPSQSPKSK